LFGLGERFQDIFEQLRRRLRAERFLLARQQGMADLTASLIALVIAGSALIWMVWKALHGLVTLGELALIYAAFNQGQRVMRSLLESVGQLYANSLFLGNLFEFLALSSMVEEVSAVDAKSLIQINRSIVFNRVSFRYSETQSLALAGFSLTIPAGKIVAIVGPNGAGKSTLLKLLCRFYDPTEGSIEIDGIDLRQIPVRELRRLITVLFQQPFHYNNTVRENIEFGDPEMNCSDIQIEEAIEAAGVEDIVKRLPNGKETLLGKWFSGGAELSVGEWQRIALARAFLRRAQLILLDEPTSALDPWAESDWLLRFRQLADRRTSIIITHRFTTAMHADVIHVLDKGQIIESGDHNELLERNGMYARSWSRQMSALRTSEPMEVG
jgi:ATP-binding cassette subfamily B protein